MSTCLLLQITLENLVFLNMPGGWMCGPQKDRVMFFDLLFTPVEFSRYCFLTLTQNSLHHLSGGVNFFGQ